MKFSLSKRLERLPPYLFAEIDKKKNTLRKKGVRLIDLSIGDPDILAPNNTIEVLYRQAKIKENQKYALDQGKQSLKRAIKEWFKERFRVSLNEDTEILPLLGSKEGLVHLPLAFVNARDYVIIPSPGYPGYRAAAVLASANVYEAPLLKENRFLVDLDRIPKSVRNKTKLMYLNYPNNPTTALAPNDFLKKVVKFCSHYGIILAYDNAYSEIYFDKKPHSVLEVKGAREVALEFHSFSKTYCMTGFRIGWACGSKDLVRGLLKVKTNIDSGIFGAIQEAGAAALRKSNRYTNNLRNLLRKRRDVFVGGIKDKGFSGIYSDSTFYVWVKIPEIYTSSYDFVNHLLDKGIVATPGVGFGKYGEGFVRFALTVDIAKLKEAIKLLNSG